MLKPRHDPDAVIAPRSVRRIVIAAVVAAAVAAPIVGTAGADRALHVYRHEGGAPYAPTIK